VLNLVKCIGTLLDGDAFPVSQDFGELRLSCFQDFPKSIQVALGHGSFPPIYIGCLGCQLQPFFSAFSAKLSPLFRSEQPITSEVVVHETNNSPSTSSYSL
jgi:hypothetical protein